jgi:hypothetical protein
MLKNLTSSGPSTPTHKASLLPQDQDILNKRLFLKNRKGLINEYSAEITCDSNSDCKYYVFKLIEIKSKKIKKHVAEILDEDEMSIPSEVIYEVPKSKAVVFSEQPKTIVQATTDQPTIIQKKEDKFDFDFASSDSDASQNDTDVINDQLRKKKQELLKKMAEIESQSVASVGTKKSVKSKVEAAIYTLPNQNSLKFLFYCVLFYICLSMLFLFLFQQDTKSTLFHV